MSFVVFAVTRLPASTRHIPRLAVNRRNDRAIAQVDLRVGKLTLRSSHRALSLQLMGFRGLEIGKINSLGFVELLLALEGDLAFAS
jgi:hypothetical protein